MEVHTAREDIRAGESHKRKACAIGTTTNRLDNGLNICHTHSLHSLVNNLWMWFHHLTHIEVLILQDELQHILTVTLLQHIHTAPNQDLLLLELLAVVVTDDVRELRILHRTVEAYAVEETLVASGIFWTLHSRQQCIQLASHLDSVNHLVLCIAWVYVTTLNLDCSRSCVEVLILQLTLGAAIHSVGEISTKSSYIEIIYATTNLLVGSEAKTNLAVLDFGV